MTHHLLRAALLLITLSCLSTRPAQAEGAFADWAVAVVAGDWRDGDGRTITAFENARRDLAAALVKAGFAPENMRLFSPLRVRPKDVLETSAQSFAAAWIALTRKATGGCLLYFTSHGDSDGIILGRSDRLEPTQLDMLLDLSCGERPTVVVVSACYSGVFVPALSAPNRMVLTAARPDRSSFGCSEDSVYPYFDGCVLTALRRATHFPALATAAQRCVAAREKAEKLDPPSEPQVAIGTAVAPTLRALPLRPGVVRASARAR